MLSNDQHPFIVNLAGSFQDEYCLYMVIEIVIGGEFFSHLRNAIKFNVSTAQFFASHVVLIFEHLHKKNIIYRDLKPENLLLDKDGYLKITDFGFAKVVDFKTCEASLQIYSHLSIIFLCSNRLIPLLHFKSLGQRHSLRCEPLWKI